MPYAWSETMKSTILIGDVRKRLGEIPSGSVRTCVTSPPYWGLRDYGTASWEGGNPECPHTISMDTKWNDPKRGTSILRPEVSGRGGNADACHLCGATRVDSQLGLEQSPEGYVQAMVEVFREVKRILTADGTLWLNIGDSYVGGKGKSGQGNPDAQAQRASDGESINQAHHQVAGQGKTRPTDDRAMLREAGLKPKDLVGIPWRLAFALQADGWYLRSDIIWHKPNPMPESVTDRPTKSHEYVFLLSKSPKYFYDHNAVREPLSEATKKRDLTPRGRSQNGGGSEKSMAGYSYTPELGNMVSNPEGRNRRSVWTINTKPFRGAHFAVMPEALVEPCILAGSEEGDTVLDPFTGSGTVAVVSLRFGRHFIGTELNPEYGEIAYNRITGDQPLMNQVVLDFSTETKEAV